MTWFRTAFRIEPDQIKRLASAPPRRTGCATRDAVRECGLAAGPSPPRAAAGACVRGQPCIDPEIAPCPARRRLGDVHPWGLRRPQTPAHRQTRPRDPPQDTIPPCARPSPPNGVCRPGFGTSCRYRRIVHSIRTCVTEHRSAAPRTLLATATCGPWAAP